MEPRSGSAGRIPEVWAGSGLRLCAEPPSNDFTPRRSETRWTGLQHSLCRTYPLSLPRDDFRPGSLCTPAAEELGGRRGGGTIMEHQSHLMLGGHLGWLFTVVPFR